MYHQPHLVSNCRSVFRESISPLTMERYTQLWIQLINQIERTNSIASGLQ